MERTLPINGVDLAYVEKGRGPPIVFVHGGALDYRCWVPEVDAAAQRGFRAIAYSQRHRWPRAPKALKDDPAGVQVQDMAAVVRALGATPAHLVGHSFGGLLCLMAAYRHPESVASLSLIEPPGIPLFARNFPPGPRDMLPLFIRRPRSALALMRFGLRTAEPARKAFLRGQWPQGMERFARGVLHDRYYETLPPEWLGYFRDNLAAMNANLTGVSFEPISDEEVRRVRVPVLLVEGADSPKFLARIHDRLLELLPQARRVVIPNASHAPTVHAPEPTRAAILDFIGSVAPAAAKVAVATARPGLT